MLMCDGSIQQAGVKMTVVSFAKFALTKHPTVFMATNNILSTLEMLRENFPNNLMSIEEGGIRIYRRE